MVNKLTRISDIIREFRDQKTPEQIYRYLVLNYDYEASFEKFITYYRLVGKRDSVGRKDVPSTLEKIGKKELKFEDIEYIENNKKEDNEIKSLLQFIKNKSLISLNELCDYIDCSPKRAKELIKICQNNGAVIHFKDEKIIFDKQTIRQDDQPKIQKPLEEKEITFGVASDLHFGSKSCQITRLHEFVETCKNKGVKHIFVPGDVVAGLDVYKGQIFDLYAHSSEEQENSVIRNLPSYSGLNWYIMGGNHCASFIKKSGHNVLKVIENQRRGDVTYVGFDLATVPLLKNVDLQMWHPDGGVPYAMSYKLQKGVEQSAFEELQKLVNNVKEKPTLRFVLCGHLHIQMQMIIGGIFACHCGCFEGTTNYLRRKRLTPAVGGWIINTKIESDGFMKEFDARFYSYREIEDDWKHFDHDRNDVTEVPNPIFE